VYPHTHAWLEGFGVKAGCGGSARRGARGGEGQWAWEWEWSLEEAGRLCG